MKDNRKNIFKEALSFYKDHYRMPEEFLAQLAKQNRDNTFIVAHLLFTFAVISLIMIHIVYWRQLENHHLAIIYFTFFLGYSVICLIWCAILRKINCLKYKANDAPLLFCAVGCMIAIWYRFFVLHGYFNAILLLGVLSVILVVLFDIEPLYFLLLDPVTTGIFIPVIYREYGKTGVFDLCFFAIIIIWLAYYSRRLAIRALLKNEMLKAHREGLQFEVEQQIEEINAKEAALLAQHQKIILIQNNTIIGLSNLVENRDSDTGEHVRRTAAYVGILASALQSKGLYHDIITSDYISLAIKAAPLHDIGKIVVPDSILKKRGKLTPEEFEQIKRHTTEGGRIVQEIIGSTEEPEYVQIAQDIASYHHEKWNGMGYPKGLKGEEIPVSARIMAIADVFDALVSPRCYKDPIPVEDAFKILEDGSGSHFDPVMIPVFIEQKEQIFAVLEKYRD